MLKLFVFCLLFLHPILGHNWLIKPVSRNGGTAFTGTTCDGTTKTTPVSVSAGGSIPSTWSANHGGNHYFYLVPSAKEATLATATTADAIATFANTKTGGTDANPTQSGSVTIPKDTTPGSYVLQYEWDGYVNCVDLNVKAASNAQNSDDPNKSIDGSSSSITTSTNRGFSVALIVMAVVAFVVVVVVVVVVKMRNPQSFTQLKQDLFNKP